MNAHPALGQGALCSETLAKLVSVDTALAKARLTGVCPIAIVALEDGRAELIRLLQEHHRGVLRCFGL